MSLNLRRGTQPLGAAKARHSDGQQLLSEVGPAESAPLAPVADVRQIARMFMCLELACAALVGLWLVLPGDQGLGKGWLALVLAGCVIRASIVGAIRRLLRPGTYSLLLGFGVALVGIGVFVSGGALSPLFVLYLCPVVFAAWYLPSRHGLLLTMWVALSYGIVVILHREPGERYWWSVSNSDASSWLLLSGTVVVVVLLVRVFRATVLDNQQRFLAGFERSATPMSLVDLDGLILHPNRAFCALLGRSAAELIAMSVLEITHPADRATAADFFDHCHSGVGSTRLEKRLQRSDGSMVWVDLASSLVRDHRGRPLYYIGQALDITARRRAEKRVELQAARHAAIAELGFAARQDLEIETLSARVGAVAAELLRAEVAVVLEGGDEKPPSCRIVATGGSSGSLVRPGWVDCWPMVQFLLEHREAVVVDDWDVETRFRMSEAEQRLALRSELAVLIPGQPEPFGVLLCGSEQHRSFTAEDVNFVQALANFLADANEHRRVREEASHAALHDPVTSLPNRALFADLLRHRLVQPRGSRASLAVLLIDIDHFKRINESFGHELGDELLRAVASRFASVLRASDVLARFGTDEFVVLCEDVSNDRALARVAQRVLATLAAPFVLAADEITVTATAGVAVAGEGAMAQSLLRDAEAAMHRAKEHSRGSYRLFDAEAHARNVGRLRTENALRRAIGSDELSVVYQPIIDVKSGVIDRVEALLRWYHPDWGPVSPVEFIPIAEETGMIIRLGHYVLGESTRQLGAWRSQGHPVSLSVNVSARQLLDEAIPELIEATLASSQVPASSITLELTESALVTDSDLALGVLQAIKDLGVDLALDDYGTGYASLSYLTRFPFDIVKLDRTLIRMLGRSRKDEIIVESTIEMSHALGLIVVAEGVETDDQHDRVCGLGCDLVQGYRHAPPLPAEELESLPAWRQELDPKDAPLEQNALQALTPDAGSDL